MSASLRQAVGVLLLLAALLALFWAAEWGQRQLEQASGQVQAAAQRERALSVVLTLVSQAESGERGYLLLREEPYLESYGDAAGQIGPALQHLQSVFARGDPAVQQEVDNLLHLTRARFAQMRESLQAYRERGPRAAIAYLRSDVGQHTTAQIATLVGELQAQQTEDTLDASRAWRVHRGVNFGLRSAALLAGIVLLWWLQRLVRRHVLSKERETEEMAERQAELERQVAQRTTALSELSTQLQSVAEQERAALSRELHDELGGLLVAARMDVTWLEQHLSSDDPAVQAHFRRVHQALQAGVDLKRRVVEELRPTLLDNLGLLAALRWLFAETCRRGGLTGAERYPSSAVEFTSEAAIAIFRIAQEALTNVLKHARARTVALELELQPPWASLRIRDDGIGLPQGRPGARSHGLAAMIHRVQALGGQWRCERPVGGGTELQIRLPLARITAGLTAEVAERVPV
ncbi:MAG: CHASE3 domain-containing protein [Gammaproteobacteria bacterium]|nr:CHASE3 domain-containing protein [Gammaproteobacteria bacterium]